MLEAPTLTGTQVQLEPIALDHVDDLLVAASEHRDTYGWTMVPADRPSMERYVAGLLDLAQQDKAVPLVQRRLADGALVGCTRYMELAWWGGRPFPDEVEVGGTWLAASAQRSGINTEAKLLLFTHAFDVWGVQRLCLCTDARNERSRAAIQRVGASFEGILRHNRASYVPAEIGKARDTAIFSITDDEWPAARDALQALLR